MVKNAAYEEQVFERAQEIQDLYECDYEDALRMARRQMESKR